MATETADIAFLRRGAGRAFLLMGSSLTFKYEPVQNADAALIFEHHCPPGDGVPPHSEHNHEAFYGLEGTLEVRAAGQSYTVEPGAFLAIRPGVVHSLHNPGADWARVLTIVSPGAQHERFFSTLGVPIEDSSNLPHPGPPPAFERVQQVARSCGIDFLPPPEGQRQA